MKTTLKHSALFFLLIAFFACKKYPADENRSVQPVKWRLSGTWHVEQFIMNGQDVTTTYFPNKLYWEGYDGNGDFEYTDGTSNTTEKGSWSFEQNKTKISRTISQSWLGKDLTILRLVKKQFWYVFTNSSGTLCEMHLVQD